MNIPKAILLNMLIKIPFVRKIARRVNNNTGINGDESYVRKTYEMYTRYSPVAGKAILELGPGHTYQCILMALENGAASADVVDIDPLIDQQVLDKHSIKFSLYDGSKLPFDAQKFDLIWSHTVYEHLRYPDMTVSETLRVLQPGGIAIHWIDLRDHLVLDNKNPTVFNMLRYGKGLWEMMTWNRSIYVNRLRFTEWVKLHEAKGFEVLHVEQEISEAVKEAVKHGQIPYLAKYNEADAVTAQMLLVVRKKV